MDKRTSLFLVGIIVLMLIGFGLTYAIIHKVDTTSQKTAPSAALANDFYTALKNAAVKQMTRSEYFHIYSQDDTKADKTAASGTTDPTTDARTVHAVTEFNTQSKELRSVLAYAQDDNVGSIATRCFGGKTATSGGGLNTTLAAAEKETQMAFTRDESIDAMDDAGCQVDDNGFVASSEHYYHDMLAPIGLSQQQADAWVAYLRKQISFSLTDAGIVSSNGKTYHKISASLNPQPGEKGAVLGLQSLLFAVRDGGKVDMHKQGYTYDTAYTPALGYDGFVLIDESTKLPVYSEFHTQKFPENAKDNGGLGKSYTYSTYSYPDAFALTPTTPLTSFTRIK
jgi:hypothetical protein